MNEFEKIKVLDESIKKWKDIVFNGGEDMGVVNCPCCQKWYCDKCIISEITKVEHCRFFEYLEWTYYMDDAYFWEVFDKTSLRLSNAMLSALYEIRRKYIVSIYKLRS